MKFLNCLFICLALASCSQKKQAAAPPAEKVNKATKIAVSRKFKEFSLNTDYIAIDTGQYANEGPMSGGSYAIIKRNGIVADTIDLSFGIQDLGNNTYLYQALNLEIDSSIKTDPNTLLLTPGNYTLVINNRKSALNTVLQHFDNNFSSPNAIKGKIYYWQLEKIDTLGGLKISAAEYDPAASITKTRFLLNDHVETDNTNYFTSPHLEKDSIVFSIDDKNKQWKFPAGF